MSNKDEKILSIIQSVILVVSFLKDLFKKKKKEPETPVCPEPDVKDEKETKVSNN